MTHRMEGAAALLLLALLAMLLAAVAPSVEAFMHQPLRMMAASSGVKRNPNFGKLVGG